MADTKVALFHNTDVGMYAVFRRSKSKARAHFTSLHNTHAQAEDEAIRLITLCVKENPTREQLFFVIRLENFFQFTDGKFGKGSVYGKD